MIRTSIRTCALLAALSGGLLAQKPPEPPDGGRPPQRPVKASWPKLPRQQAERVGELVRLLRSAKESVRARAERELAGMGSAVAPELLARMSDHRTNVNPALERVLDVVTTREHVPLLTPHLRSKKRSVRAWVLRKLAEWHVKELAPAFRKALADPDPEIAFRAAVACVSTGDLEPLDRVFARCVEGWHELPPWAHEALAGGRGPEATAWIARRIAKAPVLEQIAGVRLLRVLGDRSAVPLAASHLDSTHHALKKAAINALRVIVEDAPPLENMTVFQAIELARRWKKKL